MKRFGFYVFLVFISLRCSNEEQVRTIAIQPIGSVEAMLVDSVLFSLREIYEMKVIRLPGQPPPDEAFVSIKTPRYRADKILSISRRNKPDSVDFILTITNEDISTTVRDWLGRVKEPSSKYEDWGVFGLGYRPGPTCVVSTFRLRGSADQKKLIERLKKVCVHEIGHNLGLEHCTSLPCVMRDAAEKISTVDGESLALCQQCQEKLN